jgi:hypothetical protein
MTNDTAIRLRAKPGDSLTLEEMRASLPSIFAAEPHMSRSEKYVYINSEDMLDRLMGAGFFPVEARMSRARDPGRIGYTKHMLRFRGKNELAEPDNAWTKSGAAYEIILRNAHDGSGSYQMLAGMIKFACENGLVISDGTVAMIKVLHTGNRKRVLDNVLASAQAVLDQGPLVAEKIRRWRGMYLLQPEREAFARAAHALRFADAHGQITTAIKPEQLLIARRASDDGSSLWDTFNVVQENAIRGGISADGLNRKGRPTRFVSREVRGIDGDVRLNRGLWNLTERAAELKQKGKLIKELAA